MKGADSMAIEKIIVENFTVFEKIEIDFCNGINVFIGENGTGKTHLLKLLYAFCKCEHKPVNAVDGEPMFDTTFNQEIEGCFQNITHDTLVRRNRSVVHNNVTKISIVGIDGVKFVYGILDKYPDNNGIHYPYRITAKKETSLAVYIPAKEMLTHSRLEKDFRDRNLPFDITLIDILDKAGVSTMKMLPKEMQDILDKIAQVIGGKVIYSNDRYYIDKGHNIFIEFAVEAEGFKKLGLIYRLIETGHLKKGSVLIWDEPESNLNPKLLSIIVETLLELSRHEIQIFVTTHDYNLMKYFSMKKKENDEVAFFSLYKTEDGVSCERAEDYDLLKHNPIIDANTKLLEDEIEGTL